MLYPNRITERLFRLKGYRAIAGVDEVGRGSWAGPIVAAAVILQPRVAIRGIKDSKLLRAPQRVLLYKKITEKALDWATGSATQNEIDTMGIAAANRLAIQRALDALKIPPDFVLVDAIKLPDCPLPYKSIIKGDYKHTCIAAASIIAKVTRDAMMDDLDEQYPHYGFKQHKGYGTNHHFSMLMTHGVSLLHRKSFAPMRDLIK